MQFDVFNGDADGVCALHQMRLESPCESTLITGPKRDISLLKRVEAGAGDEVLVLDVALAKNRDALDRLLAAGVQVRYSITTSRATFRSIRISSRTSIPMPMSAPACW